MQIEKSCFGAVGAPWRRESQQEGSRSTESFVTWMLNYVNRRPGARSVEEIPPGNDENVMAPDWRGLNGICFDLRTWLQGSLEGV